jgi:hypothetical protein
MYESNLEQLLAVADKIDEESETVTYLGFFDSGVTNYDLPNCVICKIVKKEKITTRLWAEGSTNLKTKIWNERTLYTYIHRI